MNQTITDNPYQAPATSIIQSVTARGYSPTQCLRWFFLIGTLGGALGGLGTSILNAFAASTVQQVLPVGVAFAISLWVSIGLLIDRVSVGRNILLIIGCIAGFATTAVVYTMTQPERWYVKQPWTWELLRPYLYGSATGAFVIAVTVRLAGGKVPQRVLFLVWLILTVAAFLAVFSVDELGRRTRFVNELTVAFCSGGAFVAIVMSLIGWQLAIANSTDRQQGSESQN